MHATVLILFLVTMFAIKVQLNMIWFLFPFTSSAFGTSEDRSCTFNGPSNLHEGTNKITLLSVALVLKFGLDYPFALLECFNMYAWQFVQTLVDLGNYFWFSNFSCHSFLWNFSCHFKVIYCHPFGIMQQIFYILVGPERRLEVRRYWAHN